MKRSNIIILMIFFVSPSISTYGNPSITSIAGQFFRENSVTIVGSVFGGYSLYRQGKESCSMRPIPAYKAGLYGLTENLQPSNSYLKTPFIPVRTTGHSGCFSKIL